MDWPLFFVFFAACCAAAATGSMFPPDTWYEKLRKPFWNPPNWVFPVTWTILYLVIAYTGARLAGMPDNGMVMGFWALQIALNTLWTPVFFGLRRIKAGMVIIGFLWATVAALMYSAFQLDALSGWLMVPYLIWVTIAASLNGAAWVLNRNAANTPRSSPA